MQVWFLAWRSCCAAAAFNNLGLPCTLASRLSDTCNTLPRARQAASCVSAVP